MKIRAIIGLGNPGNNYYYTRHNIGFRVLDNLAQILGASFSSKDEMELAKINTDSGQIFLIKPQTFMNNSGRVIPFLSKQGIKPEEILVVHDELELPFGKIALKESGSAKGHNGLKSIISMIGDKFWRLRFGISRPEDRNLVPDYVLQKFREPESEIQNLIDQSVELIKQKI